MSAQQQPYPPDQAPDEDDEDFDPEDPDDPDDDDEEDDDEEEGTWWVGAVAYRPTTS